MKLVLFVLIVFLGLGIAACEPKKPSEPRPPTPKVSLP
jgi:hypothetical protein